MRTFLIIGVLGLFSILSFAQQFQLEATVEKDIRAIFDIDGDGICEYVADTNKVYDGLTHNLKYSLPIGTYLEWDEPQKAQNTYSKFPHLDYNSDGIREVIVNDNSIYQDSKVYIYDLLNSQILFEFNPPEENASFRELIDIDGDDFLEIVFRGYTSNYPNPDIYKTYIYSTGVTTSALEETYSISPTGYQLKQNFPNPFNPSTTIRYSLSGPENISVKIYDVSGQLVKEINKEHNQAGEYEVIWNGTSDEGRTVSSGAYVYQLSVGNYNEAKKMILLK